MLVVSAIERKLTVELSRNADLVAVRLAGVVGSSEVLFRPLLVVFPGTNIKFTGGSK
jgi:hypothetical protein